MIDLRPVFKAHKETYSQAREFEGVCVLIWFFGRLARHTSRTAVMPPVQLSALKKECRASTPNRKDART